MMQGCNTPQAESPTHMRRRTSSYQAACLEFLHSAGALCAGSCCMLCS